MTNAGAGPKSEGEPAIDNATRRLAHGASGFARSSPQWSLVIHGFVRAVVNGLLPFSRELVTLTRAHYSAPMSSSPNGFIREDPWRIFRIMAEFVDSFETLSAAGQAVTIFGSARTTPSDHYYKVAM